MASSAFKSTTCRILDASADLPAPPRREKAPPPPCPRRSRSVKPAPRRGSLLEDYAGATHTNPLFDRGSWASSPPQPPGTSRERGREGGAQLRKGRGSGRARLVSVAPPQRRGAAASAELAGGAGGGAGMASRDGSVAEEDARPYRGSEIG